MPPHKLRELQAGITDKGSEQYQRLTWQALKKSLNGLINKVCTLADCTLILARKLEPLKCCKRGGGKARFINF